MRRISHSAKADPMDAERRKTCLQWGLLAAWPTGLPARAANARRIVSVGGALTEVVFALHANADLVGVDTTSLCPVSAQKLPSVGFALFLSVGGLLALAPPQVIATEDV